jgi:5-methylcytosine-specific restriction endonuclease McrA
LDIPGQGELLESEVSPPPSPEAQLAFLAKLQRLFAESDFTATYKFALLISLADLAVEQGHDDGEPLPLANRAIAGKFIELYWQQAAPYSAEHAGATSGVLVQNGGTQAAVVSAIVAFRQANRAATAQSAGLLPGYPALLSSVTNTVSAQPIKYLQNLGGKLEPFLYERTRGGISLHPGVAYCLRRFQPLVQQLGRSHWVAHIKHNRLNQPILGKADDLDAFLFETSRQALKIIGTGLRDLSNNSCFYCGSPVHDMDVDHFIPFSLYPRDLIHNFVLTHPTCNRSKSDTLAARPHLERWLEHINRHDGALRQIGEEAGRMSDLRSTHAVARWGYANAMTSGAQAWLRARAYEPIDSSYIECLS